MSVQTGQLPELEKEIILLLAPWQWTYGSLQQSPVLEIGNDYVSQQIANTVLMMLFKSWPGYECAKSLHSN